MRHEFHGRFNATDFGLGLVIILLGGIAAWVGSAAGFITVAAAAGVLCAPLGLWVMATAVFGARNTVRLSEDQVQLNNESMSWAEVAQAIHRTIHRQTHLLGRQRTLRTVQTLELASGDRSLEIRNEWLAPADFEQLLSAVAARVDVRHVEKSSS